MRHFYVLIALLAGFINPAADKIINIVLTASIVDWTSVSMLDIMLV